MNIAVIDLDSLIFSAFHPNKILDEFGIPLRTEDGRRFVYKEKTEKEIEASCDYFMNTLLDKSNADHYIGYVKGKNTTKNRLSINPTYKDNRHQEQPKFWNFTKEYLINTWKAVEVNDYEVDDYCRITVNNLKDSFICAIDSDLLGLEGTHFNWRINKWVKRTKEEAEYKFWYDMIVGQPGDNIKGIEGVGMKGAWKILEDSKFYPARVLKNYIIKYGELLGIENFYKNYKSLYILKELDNFVIPDLNKVSRDVKLIYE